MGTYVLLGSSRLKILLNLVQFFLIISFFLNLLIGLHTIASTIANLVLTDIRLFIRFIEVHLSLTANTHISFLLPILERSALNLFNSVGLSCRAGPKIIHTLYLLSLHRFKVDRINVSS